MAHTKKKGMGEGDDKQKRCLLNEQTVGGGSKYHGN